MYQIIFFYFSRLSFLHSRGAGRHKRAGGGRGYTRRKYHKRNSSIRIRMRGTAGLEIGGQGGALLELEGGPAEREVVKKHR